MSNPVLTDGNTSVTLWQAQEDKSNIQGEVDAQNPPTLDSEDALLSGLTIQEDVELTGLATGLRLSRQSGYSDDPKVALAEWVQNAIAFVNGNQGTGYTLQSTERDREIPGVVGSFGWVRSEGSPFEVDWDITFNRGEGVMAKSPIDPGPAQPQSVATLDGEELQGMKQWREQKQQKFDPAPVTLADSPDSTLQAADSGALRRIIITGTYTGSIAERKAFDEHFQNLVGQDAIVPYQSAFPGHELDVMVNNYESTREAGQTRLGSYSLELYEGVDG